MRIKLPHPGLRMSVVLSLMVVGLQLAISMPLSAAEAIAREISRGTLLGITGHPLTMAIVNVLAFAGTIALGLFLNRLRPGDAFPWRWPGLLQVFGVIFMTLGCVVLISEADNALRHILPAPRWFMEMMEKFLEGGNAFHRAFLLVIVAPVTEELLFRGLILRGLFTRYGAFKAILFSSLLFGFVHLNPWQFVSALLLGFVLGWVYLRTGSVWLCMLGHAVVNGMFFLAATFEPNIPGVTPGENKEPSFQPWWLDLAGLAVLGLGVALFRYGTRVPPLEDPEEPPIIPSAPLSEPPIITPPVASS